MCYFILQARKFPSCETLHGSHQPGSGERDGSFVSVQSFRCLSTVRPLSLKTQTTTHTHTLNTHRLKEYEKAVTDAMKCLSIKPKFSKAYNRLATALKKQGKLRQALEACNKGLKITPDDAGLKKSKATITKKLRNEALKATAGGLSNQMNQQKAAEIQQEINKIAAKAQEFRNKIASLKHENESEQA